ncbi:hypothetical protein [Xanthomonas maliensis]|uniref:hypothetical protein n=1 Tax=Xanthomonas maliensis TaxID=1321368 RepID=UPI00039CD6F8|nr:hypothetical protein [Xanthomonas maliensis]
MGIAKRVACRAALEFLAAAVHRVPMIPVLHRIRIPLICRSCQLERRVGDDRYVQSAATRYPGRRGAMPFR